MKNTAVSMRQLLSMFPDESAAIQHLEAVRWKGATICPDCESDNIYTRKGGRAGMHDCRDCGKHFSVRAGTVFERSHIPLNKWIYGIFLLMTARQGISSLRLSKELGITQKSSWFMLRRLRLACGGNLEAPLTHDDLVA